MCIHSNIMCVCVGGGVMCIHSNIMCVCGGGGNVHTQ